MLRVLPKGALTAAGASKAAKDEVTYFFLVKDTDRGAMQSRVQRKIGLTNVNNAVKKEGGQCRLYSTRGSQTDFISVITGISAAGAVRIAAELDKRGTVKATLILGTEIFNNP